MTQVEHRCKQGFQPQSNSGEQVYKAQDLWDLWAGSEDEGEFVMVGNLAIIPEVHVWEDVLMMHEARLGQITDESTSRIEELAEEIGAGRSFCFFIVERIGNSRDEIFYTDRASLAVLQLIERMYGVLGFASYVRVMPEKLYDKIWNRICEERQRCETGWEL